MRRSRFESVSSLFPVAYSGPALDCRQAFLDRCPVSSKVGGGSPSNQSYCPGSKKMLDIISLNVTSDALIDYCLLP
jgi:hypothetical protein